MLFLIYYLFFYTSNCDVLYFSAATTNLLQLLHTPGRADRFASLASHARSGSTRVRRLTSAVDVPGGEVISSFLSTFHEYVRLAALAPATMSEWSKDAAK